MMRILIVAMVVTACGPCGRPGGSTGPALLAIVEDMGRLELRREADGQWSTVASLPPDARAFRFSPNHRHLAWIQDVTRDGTTTMQAWVLREGSDAPAFVGELGLRRIEAPGLAVADDGRVAWVDTDGVLRFGEDQHGPGRSPAVVGGTLHWISTATNCLLTERRSLSLCQPALEVLGASADTLVVADQETVTLVRGRKQRSIAVREAIAAAVSPDGRLALVRRNHEGATTLDELVVVDGEEVRSLGTRPVLVSIAWDASNGLLVVQRRSRRDLYELMLAHAPQEFGGEALAGTAMRFDLASGKEKPVPGLARESVRLLVHTR